MMRAAASFFLDQKALPRHGTVKTFEGDFRTALHELMPRVEELAAGQPDDDAVKAARAGLAEVRPQLAAPEAPGLRGEFVRVRQLAKSVISLSDHHDLLSGLPLPRTPESAATARRLVRTALVTWGLDVLADDSVLIVSELVANAVRHARRDSIRVTMERVAPRTVRVAVADFSRGRPEPYMPKDDEEDGRGLFLVMAVATNWGAEERPWGKVVWAELEARG
ncbi:DUF6415 family natural product biosynthesis protein [Streptomyces sp. NPDC004646]